MSIKIIWYAHATIGIQIAGKNLLVDPYFTGNPAAKVRPEDVPADYILVTHGHGDHIRDAVSIAVRTGAMVVGAAEIIDWFKKKGITNVHEQHIGGGFNYPFGYVKLTMALHGSNLPDGTSGGNPVGFLISSLDGKKLYLAGDTGLFGDMRLIGEEGIDLAMLPIGDNFTMGPADALRAVKLLQPKHVIPIHYSTFDLLKQDAHAWARQVMAETSTQVHVLSPGESYELI